MSCSVCLLPFVPNARSLYPRPPPKGVLTSQHESYLSTAYAIGQSVMGVVAKYDYLDNNMFASMGMQFIKWESKNTTFCMLHTTCANILRHVFDAEEDDDIDGIIRLCEIEKVLGRPMGGINASRLPFVPYEDTGHRMDRIDVRPFWQLGEEPGLNTFAWKHFSGSAAQWALARPDVFPRFFPYIKGDRLTSIGEPVMQIGILISQPLDVLLVLFPYLPISSFLALTSTCRLIRLHALTTFQPYARSLVLSLGWATPLIGVGEYDTIVSRNPAATQALVHSVNSPATGDWLLYLSHVHRTSSMRARRRIWSVCDAVKRVVEERLPSSEYGKNIAVERARIEKDMELMAQAMNNMRELDKRVKMAPANGATEPPFTPPGGWTRISMGDIASRMGGLGL